MTGAGARAIVASSPAAPHRPVMLTEVRDALRPSAGGTYVDCTLGAGGHAEAILEDSSPDGRLLGIDADASALALASARLARFGDRVRLVQRNYREIDIVIAETHTPPPDGVLMDLGVSSMQLDRAERGFSFQMDGPLDMRLDASQGETAAELVNTLPERDLADVIFRYGEERHSRRIARAIVRRREEAPLTTTAELARTVAGAMPGQRGRGIHPATRTFQALRIAANDELGGLEEALPKAAAALKPGGRLAVIAFHSLEDRIVKQFVRGATETLRAVTRKPLVPSEAEQHDNPRSRSAKLRVAEKLGPAGASY